MPDAFICENVGMPNGKCIAVDIGGRVVPSVGTTTVECPKGSPHTVIPEGYVDWHEHAEQLAKTHTQRRCPGCGLWAIWEPKETTNHA